ncbi:hydrogen gas-evolving membrane-bound hydrogenase subunit E [Planctomycetota bacterium]
MGPITMLYFLISFMIVAAIVAVEARDLLSTVISVSAAGAGLSIVFLILGAPDLAITQIVVEVLCLVILIRAVVTRKDVTFEARPNGFAMACGLIFGALLVVTCLYAFGGLAPFGVPKLARAPELAMARPYLEESFRRTGAANAVMGVLLDFRAYDTLGEATVIFTSIIGAYVLLRRVGRKTPGAEEAAAE